MESFDSTKTNLYEILNNIHRGKIQLPDFQRGWVWDDNRIKGLLASIAKSFPIGAIMLLETGNDSVRFKTKPIEGVRSVNGIKPEMLVLDGQQRLTSLYQAIITNEVVVTRNEKNYTIKRWYYIDMTKAMDSSVDLEEAIISINEKKQITEDIGRKIILDLSNEQNEYHNLMYPVCMVDEYDEWRTRFIEYWDYDKEKIKFWNDFEKKVINSFKSYTLPVIILKKENPKEAVCQVFEKVNTGGVPLTVFELLTATFASDEFDLKEDWKRIRYNFRKYRLLDNVNNTDFIQAVTLLSTYKKRIEQEKNGISVHELPAIGCKRKDMLALQLENYRKHRDDIVQGFIKTAKILIENHIYNARDLPYNTQLIPMSCIVAVLGEKSDDVGNKNKLMRWFWCGVFGELYGSANETRYALDLPQVVNWILNNGEEPKTIYDANFSPSRLHTLRSRNSAAYKGIYALLMDCDTRDLLSAVRIDFSTYYSEEIDIHHIFPVKWCENNNILRNDYDCIINKTPLSGRTNRIISGDAPSKYLLRLKKRAGVSDDEFYSILKSHVLDAKFLFSDDFYGFFKDRKEKILQKIEKAMGKSIARDVAEVEEGEYIESEMHDDDLIDR